MPPPPPTPGGDSSSLRSRLKGVKALYSTFGAFAAVLQDGSVEAWGHEGLNEVSSYPRINKQHMCLNRSKYPNAHVECMYLSIYCRGAVWSVKLIVPFYDCRSWRFDSPLSEGATEASAVYQWER